MKQTHQCSVTKCIHGDVRQHGTVDDRLPAAGVAASGAKQDLVLDRHSLFADELADRVIFAAFRAFP